jgi:amino acid transporter
VPQVLAVAFATPAGAAATGTNWGLMLGRLAILGLALAVISQYALITAQASRLPMVAGWDGVLPPWFTRLSPRFGTPVRSIVIIVVFALAAALAATYGASAQEALQIINNVAIVIYNIYFGMMFLIPLVVGSRFGKAPSTGLKLASAVGLAVTVLATFFSVFPIIDVPSPYVFGAKIIGTTLVLNLGGALLYWQSRRSTRREFVERRNQPGDPEFF